MLVIREKGDEGWKCNNGWVGQGVPNFTIIDLD
jgi:hypothetical protein